MIQEIIFCLSVIKITKQSNYPGSVPQTQTNRWESLLIMGRGSNILCALCANTSDTLRQHRWGFQPLCFLLDLYKGAQCTLSSSLPSLSVLIYLLQPRRQRSQMAFSTRSIQWSTSSRVQPSAPSVSGLTSRKMSIQKIQAPSVYGGAGGFGTRISTSSSSSQGLGGSLQLSITGNDVLLAGNEKSTMQNLNDRLAAYLERVRSLEKSNSHLEMQIREWYEKNTVKVGQDYSSFFKTIEELRDKVRDHRALYKYRNCNYQWDRE